MAAKIQGGRRTGEAIATNIGGAVQLSLYSYGVMITLAFSVGLALALRNGKYWGIAEGFLVDLAALVMLAAIIAARLTYVVMAWEDYVQEPLRIFALRRGTFFSGGLLAGFIVGVWYTLRNGYSLGSWPKPQLLP